MEDLKKVRRTLGRVSHAMALAVILFCVAGQASGQDRLCDTAFEDCRDPLWTLIDNETQGIDVSFWFMQDTSYANKIIARFQAGVPVRIIVDPRANPIYSGNEAILDQFAAAGIPMRYKVASCILHRKFMLFAGQNQVEFSGANYSPAFFVPSDPYTNYIDEAIYFTSDPSVVNSFKSIMDDMWTDTTAYGNYANVTGALTRRYSTFSIDPELNFPPSIDDSQDFYNRTASNMNQENQKIDIIMYRITNDRYTNTTISAVQRGVPVRLITEQDEYRNPDRPWDSYNVDLLYNAGVDIRIRAHQGLNHQKTVVLYGLGMTIFGSSNWTGPSSNCQAENNYFTRKSAFLSFFSDQFDRKWNSSTETQAFTPLPPDPPAYQSPADNATGVATNVTLQWEGGPWAHKFDIYFGTSPSPPLLAADQFIGRVDNGSTPETYTLPPLAGGTKYYWRIVSKTMANMTASGPTRSFTTAGSAGTAPTVSSISPDTGSTAGGTSVTINGTNFQSGATVSLGGAPATNVNVTSSTLITAVTPAHAAGTVNVTVTNPDNQSGTLLNGFSFVASSSAADVVLYAGEATVRAGNWSVVSDSSAAGGKRISNPDAGAAKLSDPLANPSNYFEMTFDADGDIPYRLWIRGKAQNDSPYNDSVFVQFSDSTDSGGSALFRIGTTSGTVINLEDCSGCGLSGWGWQDNGWGAGVLGPLIYFANSGSHTIRIQVREDGLSIDQIVLSPDTYLSSAPGALKNDTTILPESGGGGGGTGAPTVSSVTPNSGSTAGGTSVTIGGTNFLSGATVKFGGVPATNVNVAGNTSITAVTPSHAAGTVDVVVTNTDSQSGTLSGGFTYTTTAGETVLLADDFNDNSLDTAKWNPGNLFSGFTDTSLPIDEANQRIEIGPLLQGASGSHYAGLRSATAYDFTNGYCYVAVVQTASSSTSADTMLTIGKDVNGYYRIYVEGGTIVFQKRINGTKVTLASAAYSSTNHRYWRIRHDAGSGNVVFETAPDSGGSPGTWTVRYQEAWNSSAIPLGSVIFEIKGGTWQSESNAPGMVVFDNFRAAKQ